MSRVDQSPLHVASEDVRSMGGDLFSQRLLCILMFFRLEKASFISARQSFARNPCLFSAV